MERITLTARRWVPAAPGRVRPAVLDALRGAGLTPAVAQLSRIEATGGSRWTGGLRASRLPLAASVAIGEAPDGSAVGVELADRWSTLGWGPRMGLDGAYRDAFADVLARVDAALVRVAPGTRVELPRFTGVSAAPAVLDRLNARALHLGDRAAGSVTGALDAAAGTRTDANPTAAVRFDRTDGATVSLPAPAVQGVLAAGALVVGRPGALPAPLARSLERFVVRLERLVDGHQDRSLRLVVDPDEASALAFCEQQARLRAALPVRRLLVCRTCRFARTENPDYTRLARRNALLRSLGGTVGAVVSGHHVSPFVMVGRLAKVARLDPDFVCPRCQGVTAEEFVVTYCPGCGAQRREAVLGRCPDCRHDFRAGLPAAPLWPPLRRATTTPTTATAPAGTAAARS